MGMAGRVGLGIAAFALTAVCAPQAAQAAPGDLTFQSCIANNGGNGCVDPPRDSLESANSVTVTPDGNDVYVTSGLSGNAITWLPRAASGNLQFGDCIGDFGDTGCPASTTNSLRDANDVAVGPDSSSVYTTAGSDGAVSIFKRPANGNPAFLGCLGEPTGGGCTNPNIKPSLSGASGVAVSPDGESLYVASRGSDSISHFVRNPGGDIIFVDCIANNGDGGCTAPPLSAMDGARDVAVSPDGKSVYVVSDNDNSISQFDAGANGALTFAGCIASAGASGCTDPPQDSLVRPVGVAVSPDGRSVYVASETGDSITTLNRAADGGLTYVGCIADAGVNGCVDPPNDSLDAAQDVAVSPSGRSVYVASSASNSLSTFVRAADGGLTFAGCIASVGNAGCVDPSLDALDGASGVAVSPDGRSVYLAAATARAVVAFSREADDITPPGVTLKVKKPTAGRAIKATVTCTEACSVTAGGSAKPKGGRKGKLKTAEAGLAAGQPTKVKLKVGGKLKRSLNRAGKGKATITLTAADAFGNAVEATKKVKLK